MHKQIAVGLLALGWFFAPVAAAAEVTIVALGDSLTQGYGLVDGDGLVPQLQGWLADSGQDAVIINAGVSGDTTAGGFNRVDWSLTDEVDAMIVALGGNDLLRGIDPADSRANLHGILSAAAARGVPVLLAGLPAPGNFGPDFKRDFDAMYVDLAAEFGTLLEPNMLRPVTVGTAGAGAGQSNMLDPELMQPDHIHPNAAGVQRIVAALGPQVIDLIRRAEKD